MADGGTSGIGPRAQGVPQLRITPSLAPARSAAPAQRDGASDRADLSPRAQALAHGLGIATYGGTGLEATTADSARRLVAARVAPSASSALERTAAPAATPARDTMPFYTNPALANAAATRLGAASVGSSLDTTA